jgi:putative aldouronate transport system permease protein
MTGSWTKKKIHIGNFINLIILGAIGFVTLYPFWYILMYSLSSYEMVIGKGAIFRPHGFTFATLAAVMQGEQFQRSYLNTIFVVVVGTAMSLLTTALFAYPLARKIRGARIMNLFIYITMIFGGGMIPTYYIVRQTGLLDSLWSLIIPSLISPFNVFVMRSFFEGLSGEMIESASIDGATELRIFFQIIMPLSLPVVATISLFYAVGYWNKFFDALIYIKSIDKRPLQILLRELLSADASQGFGEMISTGTVTVDAGFGKVTTQTLKMATVTLSVLPVMLIYPFVQKYFVKGVMLGAVKG